MSLNCNNEKLEWWSMPKVKTEVLWLLILVLLKEAT